MSAGSFHHVIEQGMRKKQRIEDFQEVLVMEHDDLLQIPRGVSQ